MVSYVIELYHSYISFTGCIVKLGYLNQSTPLHFRLKLVQRTGEQYTTSTVCWYNVIPRMHRLVMVTIT